MFDYKVTRLDTGHSFYVGDAFFVSPMLQQMVDDGEAIKIERTPKEEKELMFRSI